MALSPDGRVIRFAIGEAGQASSALWRMWVHGNETYLGVRTLIGVWKVSLHSSGYWVAAAGSERVHINGPRELTNRITAGPRVVFAGLPPERPLGRVEERVHRPVMLFDCPENTWRDFAVLFSGPSTIVSDVESVLPRSAALIGPLAHRNGGAAWLATFVTPMTSDNLGYVRAERRKFQVVVKKDSTSLQSISAVLIQDAANGDTMFVTIELGGENVVVREHT
jgi:hypothetical protein